MPGRDIIITVGGKSTVQQGAVDPALSALNKLGAGLSSIKAQAKGFATLWGFQRIASGFRRILGDLDEIGDRLGGRLGQQAHAASKAVGDLRDEVRGISDEIAGRLSPHIKVAANNLRELTEASGGRDFFSERLERWANKLSVVGERASKIPGLGNFVGEFGQAAFDVSLPLSGLTVFGGSGATGSASVEAEKKRMADRAAENNAEQNRMADSVEAHWWREETERLKLKEATRARDLAAETMKYAGGGFARHELERQQAIIDQISDPFFTGRGIAALTGGLKTGSRLGARFLGQAYGLAGQGMQQVDQLANLAAAKAAGLDQVMAAKELRERNQTPFEMYRKGMADAQELRDKNLISDRDLARERIRLGKGLPGRPDFTAGSLEGQQGSYISRGRGVMVDDAAQMRAIANRQLEVSTKSLAFQEATARAMENLERRQAAGGEGIFNSGD